MVQYTYNNSASPPEILIITMIINIVPDPNDILKK